MAINKNTGIDDQFPYGPPGTPKNKENHYRPEYVGMVFKLLLLNRGAITVDIADFFNVNERTIYHWMEVHPEFKKAVYDGKEGSDMEVVNALYKRAIGFKETVTKIDNKGGVHEVQEYFPPEVKAQQIWLNNRRPDQWKSNRSNNQDHMGGAKRINLVTFVRGALPGETMSDQMKLIQDAQEVSDDDIIDLDA